MIKSVNANIEVILSSFGGVGTTFLIDFISKYKTTNDPHDRDGLKHSPYPPLSFSQKTKYVYVFGSPVEAVISLFRRGIYQTHSQKMLQLHPKIKPLLSDMSLREYSQLFDDKFKFESHFNRWLYDLSYQILFIRYDTVWNHIDEILNYLDIPLSEREKFPPKKERASHKIHLDKITNSSLNSLYADFENRLLEFPEILVTNMNKEFSPFRICLQYSQMATKTLGIRTLRKLFYTS